MSHLPNISTEAIKINIQAGTLLFDAIESTTFCLNACEAVFEYLQYSGKYEHISFFVAKDGQWH